MRTAMFIGAHPDDIEFGCGGLVLKLISKGYQVHFVIATRGESGNQTIPCHELAEIRSLEAQKASQLLGAHSLSFLNLEDGLTGYSSVEKINLIRKIRELKPSLLVTHTSDDQFPDHQIVHKLSIDAALGAQGPWYSQTGRHPHHYIETILGYEVWDPIVRPQLSIDITSEIDKKVQALLCHQSQLENTSYEVAAKGLAQYRGCLGFKGLFAEAYEVLKLGSLPCLN